MLAEVRLIPRPPAVVTIPGLIRQGKLGNVEHTHQL